MKSSLPISKISILLLTACSLKGAIIIDTFEKEDDLQAILPLGQVGASASQSGISTDHVIGGTRTVAVASSNNHVGTVTTSYSKNSQHTQFFLEGTSDGTEYRAFQRYGDQLSELNQDFLSALGSDGSFEISYEIQFYFEPEDTPTEAFLFIALTSGFEATIPSPVTEEIKLPLTGVTPGYVTASIAFSDFSSVDLTNVDRIDIGFIQDSKAVGNDHTYSAFINEISAVPEPTNIGLLFGLATTFTLLKRKRAR